MTFHFTLTEREYFDYNLHTAWAASHRKNYRWRYYLRVLALYAAIALLYILTNREHNIWIDVSVFLGIGIIYFALLPYFIRLSIRRRVREILNEPENHHILKPAEVVISDTGIIDRDAQSESRYDWEAIVKIDETATSYYLYTNSYHAIVIPKRVLKTQREQQQLEQLFERNLPLSSDFE